MQEIKQRIIDRIEKQKDEIIKFTQELVRTKSVNPYTPDVSSRINEPIEKGIAELIYGKLKEVGLKPIFISALSNRQNIICSLKDKGKPVLILNGHMDTVPVNSKKDWKVDPFSAEIVGGKLYGRGACDMKASLSAMVFTLAVLSEFRSEISGNAIAAFVVDEEPGAHSELGTRYLLDQGLNGDACIVCEPGTKKICIGAKGGYRLKLITKGESISTGAGKWERKEKGINAVTKMAKVLLELEKLKLSFKPTKLFEERKPVITPGTLIRGGSGINIVPDYCEATVDIRLMPGQTKEQVKKEVLACIKKLKKNDSLLKVKIQDLMFVPSVYISKEERIVKVLKENARLILKKESKLSVAGSWCDAHFFIAKGIPTICGFGPDGDNFHGANEFVYIDSIIKATKIYSLAAYDFIK